MKLPSPTEQLFAAIDYIKRGIDRWKIHTCFTCGKRNRVDIWRVLMMKVGATARCGSCKTVLVTAVKK